VEGINEAPGEERFVHHRKDFSSPVPGSPIRDIRSPELLIAVIGGAAVVVIGLVLVVMLLLVPGQSQGSEGGLRVTAAYWSPSGGA
jgi:hypothetical protein